MANQLSRDPRSGKVLGLPQLLAVMNAFTWRGGAQAAPPEELGAAARRTVSADGRIAMMALVTPREPGHPETMAYLRELRTRSWPDTVDWVSDLAISARLMPMRMTRIIIEPSSAGAVEPRSTSPASSSAWFVGVQFCSRRPAFGASMSTLSPQ